MTGKQELGNTLVIAINVTSEVCDRLEEAAATFSRKGSLLRCPSYISVARRPFFVASIKASVSSVIFIDFDQSPQQAIESSQYLTQEFPGKVTVVALTRSRAPSEILNAMRAGCSEFLNMPLQPGSLTELFDRLERRRLSTPGRQSQAGSLICFFGVKGGVGSTTLATHFAAYLAHCYTKRTLLIDNHPELGHVSVYLGINDNHCLLQDVVRNVDRLDSELLHGFVAEHPNGLQALLSPDICGAAATYDDEALIKTIDFLRDEFDYIVVDCDAQSEENNLPFIAAAQHVYLVTTPDVGAIRDLSRRIARFALHEPSLDKIQIVLNRASNADAIQPEEIEKTTGLPIAIRIPTDERDFMRACNLGEPVYPNRKSPPTMKLSEWVARVIGASPVTGNECGHKGLFAFKKSTGQTLLGKKGFAYNERH